MKYLCLHYIDEARLDALGTDELQRLSRDADTMNGQLQAAGCLLAGERLLPTTMATTVRNRPGGLAITDGPALPTRHQLASFQLIRARDLNEAIRIAAAIPGASYGCVEVRPVATRSPNPRAQEGDKPCAT